MGVLKVRDPADPTGATWIDITGTGEKGDPGGPVPTGGNPGETIVKKGTADFDVEWRVSPRVAGYAEVASVVSHATVNTFVVAATCSALFYSDRMYQITAGVRAIQDPGVAAMAQAQVGIGSVNLSGYDVWITHDSNGLFGSWSQFWTKAGTNFAAAGTSAQLTCELRVMLNQASKTIYSPRLTIIEYPM